MSNASSPSHPVGHVRGPATAIGFLSTLLVVGLGVLGILDQVNLMISNIVSQGRWMAFPKTLPAWALWLATGLSAFGLSFAILNVPGTWRRVILWITAVLVVAGWAPVLGLAAHAPEIAAPLIATLWSGVCALVYAGNHRMPCDPTPADETP